MRSRRILSGLGSRWPQKGADGELSLAWAGRVSAAVGLTKTPIPQRKRAGKYGEFG